MAADAMLQRHAVEIFHDYVSFAVVVADFVDGADIGMVQGGGGLRLALKAGQRLWVFGYFIGKKLQRDKAVQSYVLGLVHHAHSTATEFFDDPIVGDRSPGEWRRIGHWREFYAAPKGKSTRRPARWSPSISEIFLVPGKRGGLNGSTQHPARTHL